MRSASNSSFSSLPPSCSLCLFPFSPSLLPSKSSDSNSLHVCSAMENSLEVSLCFEISDHVFNIKRKTFIPMCYFSLLSPKCTQYSYQCFGKTNMHCTVGLTVDLLIQCPTCGTACKTLVLCSLLIFLGTYRCWHSITEKLLVPSSTL